MGILTNLLGDRNTEKFGDSWAETYFKRYDNSTRQNPYASPAIHLANMWCGHFGCKSEANYKLLLPGVVKSMVAVHGCLRPPSGGIALSLYMLFIEQRQIIDRYPKYQTKYGELMNDIFFLLHAKNYDELNARFNAVNPGLQLQSPFPLEDPEFNELAKRLGIWQ